MRSAVVILSLAAVWGIVASPATADPVYSFESNNYMNACNSYPWIPHDSDTTVGGVVPYFEDPATGPFVTQDGLVWLKKSSGTWSNGSAYELFTPNLENWGLRTTVSVQTSAGWLAVDDVQCNNGGYAGFFYGPQSDGGQTNLPSSVSLTGSDSVPHDTHPESYGHVFQQITVKLQAWIDPALQAGQSSSYATFAQAVAAAVPGSGVYVAEATFQVDVEDITSYPIDWPNWMGMNMPALILQEHPPLAGDANGDGKVDINDLSRVLTDYDKTNTAWSDGDFNGDHKVDINDLSIVLSNYDKTMGASAGGMSAVPEPSTLVCLIMALAGAVVIARRRAR